MSNEITSILQSLAPQHKVPRQAQTVSRTVPQGPTQTVSQPTGAEKPVASKGDRVTLTDSARLLQLAESNPALTSISQPDSSSVGKTYARLDNSTPSASDRIGANGNAQRPSPAMANMLEAFLTTSDMDGFDANSDLNADGVINFQDIAALRAVETDAAEPSESPKARLHNMIDSFFSSERTNEFDGASDLNDDGMINFQDLAILRAKMEETDVNAEPLNPTD